MGILGGPDAAVHFRRGLLDIREPAQDLGHLFVRQLSVDTVGHEQNPVSGHYLNGVKTPVHIL